MSMSQLFEAVRKLVTEGLGAGTANRARELPGAYPDSVRETDGAICLMVNLGGIKKLVALATAPDEVFKSMEGERIGGHGAQGLVGSKSRKNLDALRALFPELNPVPVGIKPGFGFGDRLGIATPGHIKAARKYRVVPFLAQQSIREMERTGRTPQEVMSDAIWGIFESGFNGRHGADADHLKTFEHIERTAAAGFTFFTIDPSDHIDNYADELGFDAMEPVFTALFSSEKEKEAFLNRYLSAPVELESEELGIKEQIRFSKVDIMRLAAKYLPAIRHTAAMYQRLAETAGLGFDFEMSIDETLTPTSPQAHIMAATELRELGVRLHSLAPRFVGQFQKAIDYIGGLEELKRHARLHALIARALGPYKLSIHSGSDKFSAFPILAEATKGLVHEKTAGTSYLEALRTVAAFDPALYREIHAFALEKFQTDRASYHVTTDLNAIPALKTLKDGDLPALMNHDHARQLIHITYGSVLSAESRHGGPRFKNRIFEVLSRCEREHYEALERHFDRHLQALGFPRR